MRSLSSCLLMIMRSLSSCLLLITVLLCGCGRENEVPAQRTSLRASPIAVGNRPAGGQPGDGQDNNLLGGYVNFPSAGAEIRQPTGFEKADSFDGFQQADTQSSIMAVSVQGPFKEMAAGFSQELMRARGWTLRGKVEIEVEGLPGLLVHFEQPVGSAVFLKWSLAFGDEQRTTMVTATFPAAQEQNLSERLRRSVLSARPSPTAPPEPGTDLPFTITASQKLKLIPAVSKMLLYTKDGAIPTKSPNDPLFVAGQAIGNVVITGNQREYAEKRLRGTAETKHLAIVSTEPVTIAGLDGYESVAAADDAKSGTPLAVYQVMLFNGNSYFLMQGLVGTELQGEFLPEFKAMARSFRRQQR